MTVTRSNKPKRQKANGRKGKPAKSTPAPAAPLAAVARTAPPYVTLGAGGDYYRRNRKRLIIGLLIVTLVVLLWNWLRPCSSFDGPVQQSKETVSKVAEPTPVRKPLKKVQPKPPVKKTTEPEVEDFSLFQPDPVHTSLSFDYTTRKGDTLELVAKNVLGNPKRWTEIRDINRLKIGATYKLPPNRVIVVPLQ